MDMLISVLLPVVFGIMILSLGLGLDVADFSRVLRQPKAFGVGIVVQMVCLPLVTFLVIIAADLPPELAVGMMILAFCPGSASSNILTKYASGDVALSVTLTGVISLASAFVLPELIGLSASYFLEAGAEPAGVRSIGFTMFLLTAVPVAAGMLLRRYATAFARRIEPFVSKVAMIILALVICGAIVANWGLFVENIAGLGPAAILVNVLMILVALSLSQLFGLSQAQATAISLEVSIQNAAFGLIVGSLIVEQASALPPFSLPSGVYGITMYLVSVPFALLRRREAAAVDRTMLMMQH